MKRSYRIAAVVLGLLSAIATGRAQSASAGKASFSGVWILNRDLSDAPPAPGLGARAPAQGGDQDGRAGRSARGEVDRPAGDGGRGVTGNDGYRGERSGPMPNRPDRRSTIEQLTSDMRNPSASLTISHADPTLAVTDARERTRLFQTNGQKDPHQVGDATVLSTTKWDGDRLVTEYDLGNGRKIRTVYSIVPSTRQLLEQVTFANGQTMKRVYDPARSTKRE